MLVLGTAAGAWAGTIFVKADATGGNRGASWHDAYTDLQDALTTATQGDEIWVAAGIYKPTTDTNRSKSFVMRAGVGLYGGFAGIETETTRTQRDWTAHLTILSGDIGTSGTISDNSNSVVIGANNAVLDGFTITGGNANGSLGYGNGGGMINDSVSPTIANCTFSGNVNVYAGGQGGGMHNSNASPTVTNCTFSGNTAESGGGIYNAAASPTVLNCTFSGNVASAGDGGGMENVGSSPTVINCTFTGNAAYVDFNLNGLGGGMDIDSGSPTLINCTFTGNVSNFYGSGSGMDIYAASPTVTNCIFWGDDATYGPEICNLFASGNPTFFHCDIQGSLEIGDGHAIGTVGEGNIMSDPLFVNAAHPAGADGIWRTADDGLRLQAGSPCIDAGLATGAPLTDILGYPRVGAPDIGAYETIRNAVGNWALYQ